MYIADRVGGADMFLNALYRKEGGTFEDPAYIKAGELVQELVKRDFFPKGVQWDRRGYGSSTRLALYRESCDVSDGQLVYWSRQCRRSGSARKY